MYELGFGEFWWCLVGGFVVGRDGSVFNVVILLYMFCCGGIVINYLLINLILFWMNDLFLVYDE